MAVILYCTPGDCIVVSDGTLRGRLQDKHDRFHRHMKIRTKEFGKMSAMKTAGQVTRPRQQKVARAGNFWPPSFDLGWRTPYSCRSPLLSTHAFLRMLFFVFFHFP